MDVDAEDETYQSHGTQTCTRRAPRNQNRVLSALAVLSSPCFDEHEAWPDR